MSGYFELPLEEYDKAAGECKYVFAEEVIRTLVMFLDNDPNREIKFEKLVEKAHSEGVLAHEMIYAADGKMFII